MSNGELLQHVINLEKMVKQQQADYQSLLNVTTMQKDINTKLNNQIAKQNKQIKKLKKNQKVLHSNLSFLFSIINPSNPKQILLELLEKIKENNEIEQKQENEKFQKDAEFVRSAFYDRD